MSLGVSFASKKQSTNEGSGMTVSNRPSVVVALKVRPKNARYDLLELTINGAPVAGPDVGLTGDRTFPVIPALISPDMGLRATINALSGPMQVTLLAWSSWRIDDPSTLKDETLEVIDVKSGSGTLQIKGEFDPYETEAEE